MAESVSRKASLIERAYELARSGKHATTQSIERALVSEGYEQVAAHFGNSLTLKRALLALCREKGVMPQ